MLHSLKFLLLLSALLSSAQAQLALEVRLVRRPPPPNPPDQRNIVTLECILTNTSTGALYPIDGLSYHYRDPVTSFVTNLDFELHDTDRITFAITPDTEGDYFCRDASAQRRESNDLQLTAYPVPDESLPTVYAAQERGLVILLCDFKLGRLRQLYTYQWNKADRGIITNGAVSEDPDKYVATDSSLLIKVLDRSDNESFWCQVTVNNPGDGNPFIKVGRAISLEVFDAVRITEHIESQVVRERERTEPFTCVAEGTPLPTIQWRFGGSVIGNSGIESGLFDVTMETDDNEITSTLTVREAQTRDNVEIVCIATNKPLTQPNIFTNCSIANLGVLPTQVSGLVLAAAASSDFTKAFIDFNLPDPILGEALLHVRYLSDTTENVPYPQAMVENTLLVHFELPREDWEDFSSFRVRVALTATSEVNPSDDMFTESSNLITIRDDSLLTDNHIYAIIGAGVIVLIVLLIVVGIVSCRNCGRKMKPSAAGGPIVSCGDEELEPPWQADYYRQYSVEESVAVSIDQHVYESIPEGGGKQEEGEGSKEENRCETGTGGHVGSDDEEEREREGQKNDKIATHQNMSYQRLLEQSSPPPTICSDDTTEQDFAIQDTVPLASDQVPPCAPKEESSYL